MRRIGPRRTAALVLAAVLPLLSWGCSNSKPPVHFPPRPPAAPPGPGADPNQSRAESPQHVYIYDP